jgi:hypothetical protein
MKNDPPFGPINAGLKIANPAIAHDRYYFYFCF